MRGRRLLLPFLLAAVAVAGCKDAQIGQSSANESPVPDGYIVLLKRTNERAAFILRNQKINPETTDYDWYYRADGRGTFPVGDPAVSTGYVSNASQVAFATFTVDWSINANGKGWVYFSRNPAEFGMAADYLMCVTTETNLAVVDAGDPSWDYRARPSINVKALIESRIRR